MKKLILGLIILFTTLSTYSNNFQENKYFDKPIFNLLKITNNNLYQNLINGNFQSLQFNDKNVVVIQVENGYFIDDSEEMIYSEINKKDQTITVNNFNNNTKAIMKLKVEDKIFTNIADENSINIVNFIDQETATANNVTFSKSGCRDYAGFALCYGAVLLSSVAIASSDGPLPFMDGVAISYAITSTAGCYRSNCK